MLPGAFMSAEIHVLKFLTGKYKGEEFPLGPDGEDCIAGRSSEADLVLADDAVSRKHARFYVERRRTWVRDLGSRNGTLVNGLAVKRHCLRPGDKLAIGASLMTLQVVKPSQVSAAPRAGEKKARPRPTLDFSNRSMAGNIEEIPLAGVLQFLAASRKSGTLQLRDGESARVGRVSMRDGFIANASIEGSAPGLRPEKAVMRMLGWVKGTFSLENAGADAGDEGQVVSSIEHVLMESAHQQDEILHLSEKTPVPRYNQEVALVQPGPVRWRGLTPEQLDMVQDLAEGRGWAFILDTYAADDLELTRMIVELRKKRVVEYE